MTTKALALAAVGVLALVTGVPETAGGSTAPRRPPPAPSVTLSARPDQLDIVGLPCLPGTLTVGMANPGDEPVYADTFISAADPLEVSRGVFSSYVPAGTEVTAPVQVATARDTPPGDHEVVLQSGRAELRVPVSVLPLPPRGPGDNLALGERAEASSTHGSFDVCGGVDGNRSSDDWNSTDRTRTTGWNDGTSRVFPDHYGVRFPEPTAVAHLDVYTLDSARYPASRHGLRDWDVQVQVGGAWQTVAQVRGNTTGHVTSSFTPVTAEAVRIVTLASNDGSYSRVVELEASS
jgi:hypothetical protein